MITVSVKNCYELDPCVQFPHSILQLFVSKQNPIEQNKKPICFLFTCPLANRLISEIKILGLRFMGILSFSVSLVVQS